MDKQFNTNVYHFTDEVLRLIFDKFDGNTLGSEDMMKEAVMKELFGEYKPKDNPEILQCTSESQGHGKAWEIDIQDKVYSIKNPKDKYKSNAKYDIPAEDNVLHHKNVSIKASGGMCLCMSDIKRMLNSENMYVICIIWKQINPKIKEAIKTVVFDFDEFKKTLIEDLKKCNYTL